MFASAESALSNYIDTTHLGRFNFYSVEMERGENIEDLYYLCSTRDGHYVAFETDYILGTLADIAHEATEIFKGYGFTPLHWIVKKDAQASVGSSTIPIDAENLEELRESLFSNRVESTFSFQVRYAVMEFKNTKEYNAKRFHPATYGSIDSQQ